MKFVLRKINLSDTYPVEYYLNRQKLVGINPSMDSMVLPWLQALFDVYTFGAEVNPVKKDGEWFFESLESKTVYVIFYYDDKKIMESVFNSRQMKEFEATTDKLYPVLGWEEQGQKVIHEWDDTIPKTFQSMEELWNSCD
jgi:hypothetical protein